jgi:hypothetical protein
MAGAACAYKPECAAVEMGCWKTGPINFRYIGLSVIILVLVLKNQAV